MKVCIDIDDYHTFPKWDCSDVIERFVEAFPDIKFTLFVTPWMKKIAINDYPQAAERIINLIDNGNVEVFLHGLTHMKILKGEFGLIPESIARKRIERAEKYLKRANIQFKKGIKFPWDMYGRGAMKAAFSLGYVLFTAKKSTEYPGKKILLRKNEVMQKRYIQPEKHRYKVSGIGNGVGIIYYHGHAQNVRSNGIRESYKNFLNELSELKRNYKVEFIFCSDLIGEDITT